MQIEPVSSFDRLLSPGQPCLKVRGLSAGLRWAYCQGQCPDHHPFGGQTGAVYGYRQTEVANFGGTITSAKVRPHVGCHQCPRLAHLQMAAGGAVGGIAVTTVGEAEVFSDAGFNDIPVTREVVTKPAIHRWPSHTVQNARESRSKLRPSDIYSRSIDLSDMPKVL